MYCKPDDLRAALIASQEAGELTPEFVRLLRAIVSGFLGRWRYRIEPDELLGMVCIAILKRWQRLDPDRNLFCYLTTITHNAARLAWRSEAEHARVIASLIDKHKYKHDLPG